MSTQIRIILLFTLALGLAGCGKKQAASTANQSAAPPTAETNANEPLVGEVDAFMTSQLRIFIQQNGRLPKDFAEFARARMDSVPRTPPGMKWAIDTVTREVKLVKQ